MNPKTAIITTPYFPPQGGGLERYALQAARLLERDYGWKITMISSGENDSIEKEGDIKIYKLRYNIRFSNTPLGASWPTKIKRILKNERPGVINIHTPVPGLGDIISFLGRDIPQVITYHTGTMKKGRISTDILLETYEKIFLPPMLERTDSIICSSDFVRLGFLKKYSSKSSTITPGVDCELFTPNPEDKPEKSSILFVAKLENGQQYKGLKTLIDAAKIIAKETPDLEIKVAGDGDMREWYERYAKDNGLAKNVKFLGSLEGSALLKAYQSSHLFVLPTSKDSYPLVLLEAMSCGLPVISTRIGSIPDIVKNGSEGFLVSPEQPQELADSIKLLSSNRLLRQEFSQAAREKATANFSWKKRISEYDKIMTKALVKKNSQIFCAPSSLPKQEP